jgi:hypothetical protein
MDNVYVITCENPTDRSHKIIGVFSTEVVAEITRNRLTFVQNEMDYDAGIFYRITAYQLGKLYPVDVASLDAII